MYHDDDYYHHRQSTRGGRGRSRRLRADPARGWLGGVCAGIGRHLDIDPAIVRIAVGVVALWAPGFTVGGYAVAWFLMSRA